MKLRTAPLSLFLLVFLSAAPAVRAARTAPRLDALHSVELPPAALSRLADEAVRPSPPATPSLALLSPASRSLAAALTVLDEPERASLLARRRFRLAGPAFPFSRLGPSVRARKTASWQNFRPGEPNLKHLNLFNLDSRQGDLFIEPDPLGPVDSPNLYQAFGFDGLNVRDPFGLELPKKALWDPKTLAYRVGKKFYQVNVWGSVYELNMPVSREHRAVNDPELAKAVLKKAGIRTDRYGLLRKFHQKLHEDTEATEDVIWLYWSAAAAPFVAGDTVLPYALGILNAGAQALKESTGEQKAGFGRRVGLAFLVGAGGARIGRELPASFRRLGPLVQRLLLSTSSQALMDLNTKKQKKHLSAGRLMMAAIAGMAGYSLDAVDAQAAGDVLAAINQIWLTEAYSASMRRETEKQESESNEDSGIQPDAKR